MQAPSEVREKYFNMYESITLEATNCSMEEEVSKLELQAQKRKLEKMFKGVSTNVYEETEMKMDKNGNVIDVENHLYEMKLFVGTPIVESSDLANCSKGQDVACVHNRDSSDFMNEEKFECIILK